MKFRATLVVTYEVDDDHQDALREAYGTLEPEEMAKVDEAEIGDDFQTLVEIAQLDASKVRFDVEVVK